MTEARLLGRASAECDVWMRAPVELRSLRGRPPVGDAAEPEDDRPDVGEDDQADAESCPAAIALRQVEGNDDPDDEPDDRDQHQDDPPPLATDDLQEHEDVPDRDDCLPPGLARLGEDHPPTRDDRDDDRDVDEPDDATHVSLRTGELDRPTMTRDADGGRPPPGVSAEVVTI